MDKTGIQWTDATWNPTRGCRRVSPGCVNCYAEKVAARFCGDGLPYEGLIRLGKWNGEARFVPDKLDLPLRWRKPRRIFVDSMSDLFYEGFTDDQIAAVFGVMAACPQHTFQVLTKRTDRALKWFERVARDARTCNAGRGMDVPAFCLAHAQRHSAAGALAMNVAETYARPWPLPNVWIGASVENQEYADKRIPDLLKIPAAVRFVSYEPALGPVDFRKWLDWQEYRKCSHCHAINPDGLRCITCGLPGLAYPAIDWIIVGGESGTGARPFDMAWARSMLEQARDGEQCGRKPAVFVKQLGARPMGRDCEHGRSGQPCRFNDPKGGDMSEWPEDLRVREWPAVRP